MMLHKAPILLFLPFLLVACATVQQMPPPRFNSDDLSFIQPGITTRDEVISKLGVPAMDLSDIGILLYLSIANKSDWLTYGAVPGSVAVERVAPGRDGWALLVAMDENNHVVRWGLDRRRPTDSLLTQARSWAEGQGLSVTPLKTSFASLPVPAGKGVIYIYNKAAPFYLLGGPVSWPFPVAVALDGQYATEMRVATYAALPVSSGRHEIVVDPLPPYSPLTVLSAPPKRPAPITVEVSQGQAYYLETLSTTGYGSVATSLTLRTESEAMPVLKTLRPVW